MTAAEERAVLKDLVLRVSALEEQLGALLDGGKPSDPVAAAYMSYRGQARAKTRGHRQEE